MKTEYTSIGPYDRNGNPFITWLQPGGPAKFEEALEKAGAETVIIREDSVDHGNTTYRARFTAYDKDGKLIPGSVIMGEQQDPMVQPSEAGGPAQP